MDAMNTIRPSRSRTRGTALLACAATALASALVACSSNAASNSSHSAGLSRPAGESTTQHQQTSSAASRSGSGKASGKGCAAITSATLKALFTVPVGEPYDEGSGACEFGLGANAKLRGSAVQTANGDSLLAQLIPGIGASEYNEYTSRQPVTPLAGIGDKASFADVAPFKVFAVKGQDFCLIQIGISNAREVGLNPDSTDTIPAQEAKTVATKAGALCTDMFNGSG